MRLIAVCFLGILFASLHLHGGVEEDWGYIVSLDAGPKKKPVTRDEAALVARNHLLVQRKAIEQFLLRYPSDQRVFDARLSLARILAAEGKMANNQGQVDEALKLLGDLETSSDVSREKLAEAGFARASLSMQNQKDNGAQARESIIWSAQNFTAKYPGDRRGPRLLVEAATVCDEVPNQKRDLLEEALRLTDEEPLKRRIADDLRRLDLLGRPLELKMSSVSDGLIDLTKLRGDVVILIFWSADSPHSLLWLRDFRSSWETLPKDHLRVVTVSLDENRITFEGRFRELRANWPTHFDGLGWRGPIARSLGINSLPTVWIIDKKGILRSINVRSSYETWISQLLREDRPL
jgi:thioredoxin family protein